MWLTGDTGNDTAPCEHLVHRGLQVVGTDRLVDEIGSTIVDCLDGQFQIVLAGHHDDVQRGLPLQQLRQ